MNALPSHSELHDPDLVARVLDGDRDSFGALVTRHQSAVCGMAYSICGDFKQSEDIAQDAFVAAWRKLAELREGGHFRAWVCGIARQLALSHVRTHVRRGVTADSEQTADAPSPEIDPREAAITEEEKALLRRSLDALPDTYREPLVLFYREQESVASVATALGLSEDAVKQRLSRGRVLLRDEVARHLENVLGRTRPGAAFTLAVMGALPPIAGAAALVASASTAKAASAGAGMGASTGTKLVPLAGSGLAVVLSSLLGLFWCYAALRLMNAPWMPKAFRRRLTRVAVQSIGLSLALAGIIAWVAWTHGAGLLALGLPVGPTLVGVVVLFIALNVALMLSARRTFVELNDEYLRNYRNLTGEASMFASCARRHESRVRFAGLPLLSIAFGAAVDGSSRKGVARGWIALGDTAWGGLIAVGGIAVAPIAAGGITVGLISLGGAALGAIAFGGLSLGWLSLGGIAMAVHWATGGLAMALGGAVGGLAVARDWAIGGAAFAAQANNQAAFAAFNANPSLQFALKYAPYLGFLSLLGLPSLVSLLRKLNAAKSDRKKP